MFMPTCQIECCHLFYPFELCTFTTNATVVSVIVISFTNFVDNFDSCKSETDAVISTVDTIFRSAWDILVLSGRMHIYSIMQLCKRPSGNSGESCFWNFSYLKNLSPKVSSSSLKSRTADYLAIS